MTQLDIGWVGELRGLVDRLRGRLRVARGRVDLPTAGSIDSRSVKAADTVRAASRGVDGGKKINAPHASHRRRHSRPGG